MSNLINKGSRGFTLIELLVVIAIIGILSSVVLASLSTARAKSRDARRISDLGQVQLALELYFDSSSTYPVAAINATQAAFATNLAGLTPTYIPKIPADPQSTAYYVYVGAATTYNLGAVLERTDNTALLTDADGTATGFDGGHVGCLTAGAASDNCYDVKP